MNRSRKKPTFVLVAALSLDGRLTAGDNEGSEWTSKEDKRFFQNELDRADAIIMGRRTYEAIKRPLRPRNRIVLSRSASPPLQRGRLRGGGCLIILKDPTAIQLMNLLKKHLWTRIAVVGGTAIYDWFLKRGLVDELCLTLEPVVFGAGKLLTDAPLRTFRRFSLKSVKHLNKRGTLLLHYQ